MQGDSTSYNSSRFANNNYFVYCKPDSSVYLSKSDSLQRQSDSLSFRYFFDFRLKHYSGKSSPSSLKLRESIFTSHQLEIKNPNPIQRESFYTDWMVLLLLVCFSLLAWILSFSRKRLKQIIKATYSNRTINQLIRDGDLFKERISIAFAIIYFLSISLFVFQIGHYYFDFKRLGLYSFFSFVKILTFILVFYILKNTATKIIGYVFKNNSATYFYLLNGFIFNIITGIIILPLLLFLVYSNGAINSFTAIFAIIFVLALNVLRYLRYIIIGVSFSKFSHFYLFLYLCILEILPILIIIKVVIGLINSKV